MTTPDSTAAAVAAALPGALAVGTRDAFEQLLTEDVHWGGERGRQECRTRGEAGDHYAGLLASGVTLRVAGLAMGDEQLTVRLLVTSPDPDEYPAELTVRLMLRAGHIADIRELNSPPTIELLYFDGCPQYDAFLPRLRRLLAAHHVTAPVSLIRIDNDEDAQRHRFLGSPTLRVDGRDVDPTAAGRDTYGLQCLGLGEPAQHTARRLWRDPRGSLRAGCGFAQRRRQRGKAARESGEAAGRGHTRGNTPH